MSPSVLNPRTRSFQWVGSGREQGRQQDKDDQPTGSGEGRGGNTGRGGKGADKGGRLLTDQVYSTQLRGLALKLRAGEEGRGENATESKSMKCQESPKSESPGPR